MAKSKTATYVFVKVCAGPDFGPFAVGDRVVLDTTVAAGLEDAVVLAPDTADSDFATPASQLVVGDPVAAEPAPATA